MNGPRGVAETQVEIPLLRTTFLSFLLIATACKRPPPVVAAAQSASLGSSASTGPVSSVDPATQAAIDQVVANFARVYFALDSASLSADARQALANNARILQDNPDIRVEIQGHADERGTVDYNLALGMRRADSVAKNLAAMGVSPNRVRAISFGEERPATRGSSETVWSKNRRCEFRVTAGRGAAGTIEG